MSRYSFWNINRYSFGSTMKRDDSSNKKNQMSGKGAEAIASEIIFEAEQY